MLAYPALPFIHIHVVLVNYYVELNCSDSITQRNHKEVAGLKTRHFLAGTLLTLLLTFGLLLH